jgi:hypothetical protein
MDDSIVTLQTKRSQFRARRPVILVKNASNPQSLGDLHEHGSVLDIEYLPGPGLGDVQRKPEDIRIGLADVDEAG